MPDRKTYLIRKWKLRAYEAGKRYGRIYLEEIRDTDSWLHDLNRIFWKWTHSGGRYPVIRGMLPSIAKAFAKGFCRTTHIPRSNWVLMPTRKSVAAIVMDGRSIVDVLDQLYRLPFSEIIVVSSTCDSNKEEVVSSHPAKPVVIHLSPESACEAGRELGAKASTSEYLLFCDGNFSITAEQLLPFIDSLAHGADIALNNTKPFLHRFYKRNRVSIAQEFINMSLGRRNLMANSLSTLPHGMSRKAVETIGFSTLAVPPIAHAKAIAAGLKVKAPATIPAIWPNKGGFPGRGFEIPISAQVIGDHLEAISQLIKVKGSRLHFLDKMRNRDWSRGPRNQKTGEI